MLTGREPPYEEAIDWLQSAYTGYMKGGGVCCPSFYGGLLRLASGRVAALCPGPTTTPGSQYWGLRPGLYIYL